MRRHVFPIIFTILFIVILIFQYTENYKFRINPPSEEWSKEVLIGNVDGAVKTYPKMLNYMDGGYVIAYQNGTNINVRTIDKLGKKINETVIPLKEEFIRNLNLLSDGEYNYVNWITSDNGIKTIHNIKMDKNLALIDENQESGINESVQLGEETLILTFEDKIVLRDIKSNTNTVKNVNNPELVAGVNTNKGYLVTYYEDGRYFKYFFIKDGVVSESSLAATLSPDAKGGYFDRVSLGSDNKYAYIMVESKTAEDRYGTIKCISFALDGNEKKIDDLRIGTIRNFFGAISISSGDEARFIVSGTRKYERKGTQDDIIDFTIKNREIIKYTFATRTNEPSMYPAANDDSIVFFDYLETNKYDIYMASMNQEYKDIYNLPRDIERNRALVDTMMGFVYSILYIFLVGLKWIIAGLTSISIVSFIAHEVREKYKKILFVISYLILAAVKTSTIYGLLGEYKFPTLISSPTFAIVSCLFISLLCLIHGYIKYSRNLDALPLRSFVYVMFIDTVLTQMIFIPYIY